MERNRQHPSYFQGGGGLDLRGLLNTFFGGDGGGPGEVFSLPLSSAKIHRQKIKLEKNFINPGKLSFHNFIKGAGFIPTIGDGPDGEVVIDGEGDSPPPPCGLLCTMLREFQVNRYFS